MIIFRRNKMVTSFPFWRGSSNTQCIAKAVSLLRRFLGSDSAASLGIATKVLLVCSIHAWRCAISPHQPLFPSADTRVSTFYLPAHAGIGKPRKSAGSNNCNELLDTNTASVLLPFTQLWNMLRPCLWSN